jgi:hypothetical protein
MAWMVCIRALLFLGGPKQVIEYLGRYTHKIAISNHRLLCVENQGVSFSYRDYRQGGQQKIMILPPVEFVRRFAQHILPKGFVRIRHYGILSSCWKPEKLPQLQAMLDVRPSEEPASEGTMLHRCPSCREGVLRTILYFGERGPPSWSHGGTENSPSCNA